MADDQKPAPSPELQVQLDSIMGRKPAAAVPAATPAVAQKLAPTSSDDDSLRHLAGLHLKRISAQQQHDVDPRLHPHQRHEAHLAEARHTISGPIGEEWNRAANNAAYKATTQPQRWRQQRDFINQYHAQHPDHADKAVKEVDAAHQAGTAAKQAFHQEEYRKVQEAAGRFSSPQDFDINDEIASQEKEGVADKASPRTAEEAAAHLGHKEGEDRPTVNIQGSAAAAQGARSPEAIQQLLDSPRFANIPEEDVVVPGLKGKMAPIAHHPDLDVPENKRLMDKHIGKFMKYLNEDYITTVKNNMTGAGGSEFNPTKTAAAAERALHWATHRYNPNMMDKDGKPVDRDTYIRQTIHQAIKGDISKQHAEQTGAAVKRAVGDVKTEEKADPEKQAQMAADTKLVTAQSDPEKHQKLMEEAKARMVTEEAHRKANPNLERHLTPEQRKRLQHVLSVKPAKSNSEPESGA